MSVLLSFGMAGIVFVSTITKQRALKKACLSVAAIACIATLIYSTLSLMHKTTSIEVYGAVVSAICSVCIIIVCICEVIHKK